MKEFIFLYPITEHIDSCLKLTGLDKANPSATLRINNIIDARYRQTGFNINWLMFNQSDNSKRPDMPSLSKYIFPHQEDPILLAGISRKTHTQKIYPDPLYILSQLHHPIGELVIGGFHQWDCVDKLAATAYRVGIKTFVDEDLTEIFFFTTTGVGQIPLVREGALTLADRGIEEKQAFITRSRREGKPWFTSL